MKLSAAVEQLVREFAPGQDLDVSAIVDLMKGACGDRDRDVHERTFEKIVGIGKALNKMGVK